MKREVKIEPSWKNVLQGEFTKDYWQKLTDFVRHEYQSQKIYPAPQNIFKAFELCPFDQTKVVILGQDPYHTPNVANGLSFATSQSKIPPSLQNIFKEISAEFPELKIETQNGDLTRYAKQGVLLLNATLTVRENSPTSHSDKGWELFTDEVIKVLSDQKENLVFILWGNYAKQKGKIIDRQKHLVLESAHPSPFSANHGFLGNQHFIQTNKYLREHSKPEIDWR